MINRTTIIQVFILVVLALFLRIYHFSFPAFTTDEARIAFRGYSLYTNGVDELGRKLPLLFNSLNDYQLPLVSYISALGAGIFGKSELGARAPFIIMGLIMVLLTYKVATLLSQEKSFHFLSAFIVAISPVLIFVSKVPNESIIATTLFLLLFYLLIKDKLNIITIIATIILLILTTKFSWFILPPFVIYTVFIYRNASKMQDKLKISLISIVFVILAFVFFFQIPQGIRSLSENNLSLMSDISIKNGINWIRGEGLKSGWPPILEQMLINKSSFLLTGILHWFSGIQPAVFFSQFSKDENLGFTGTGAFPRVTIIPGLIGLFYLIREKKNKLLLYPLIITLPAALIYPIYSPQIVVLTLPFVAYIIAFGLIKLKRIPAILIIIFMIIELFFNLFFLAPKVKMTGESRPDWIKPVVKDAFLLSTTSRVLISDDITLDPAPFVEWYTPINVKAHLLEKYPYKLRQNDLENIKLVGFSDRFRACGAEIKTKMFLTKRDLDRVRKIDAGKVLRTYLNSKSQAAAFYIEGGVCID